MNPDYLLHAVIGFVVLALGICFFIAYRMGMAAKARVAQFIGALGGSPGATRGLAVSDGIRYRFHFVPGGYSPLEQVLFITDIIVSLLDRKGVPAPRYGGSPPSFSIEVEGRTPGAFFVRREGGQDRFAKRVGLKEDTRTHDSRFDEAFFVESDTPDWTKEFLSADRRDLICKLFALGVDRVEHDGQAFRAIWRPFKEDPKTGLDPAPFRQAVAHLAGLAEEGVPQPVRVSPESAAQSAPVERSSEAPHAPRPARGSKPSFYVTVGALYALVFLAVAAYVFGNQWFPPVSTSTMIGFASIYGAVALLVCACILVIVGRRSGWTGEQFLFAGIPAVMIAPLAGAGIGIFLNGWLDSSPEILHTVRVRDRQIVRSASTPIHIAVVESWYQPGSPEEITVSKADYDRTLPAYSLMTVKTRQGALGLAWFQGYELQSKDPSDAVEYLKRGRAGMAAGLHDQAVADFTKVTELAPTTIEAYRSLDRLLSRRKQWQAIITHWSRYIALQPESAEAYLERGGAHFQKGDRAAAVRDAEKACQLGNKEGCRQLAKFRPQS
jgi:hypothetical protein